MNLHLNPFEKAKLAKEEEKRKEIEKLNEEVQLKKMLDKLKEISSQEKKDKIGAGSAQVLARSSFNGLLSDDKKVEKVEPKRFAVPKAFIDTNENPDFYIDESKAKWDEHDYLMNQSDAGSLTDEHNRIVDEIRNVQASSNFEDMNELFKNNPVQKKINDNIDYRKHMDQDDEESSIFLQGIIDSEIQNNFKHGKEDEDKQMEDFGRKKNINNIGEELSADEEFTELTSNLKNDEINIDEDTNSKQNLTEQWEDSLGERVNRKFNDVDFNNNSYLEREKPASMDELLSIAKKESSKIGGSANIKNYQNSSDNGFDYNKQAFGKFGDDSLYNSSNDFVTKTIQKDDITASVDDVMDFFSVNPNDMSFALNIIRGTEFGEEKLTTREGLLEKIKEDPKLQQVLGIIGSKQYLSQAYFDLKKQISNSNIIHLNMRKTFMYSSPILFLTKHFISQLPEINTDDKKILWKRCANLLSATKFSATKYSEEIIFDKELAITDPITNIKREFTKVLNAYDLGEERFVIIIDEIRGIDDEQFLNCISYLTLVFENLTNFKLVFEIETTFIKINAASTKMKLGLAMIDFFTAENKLLLSQPKNDDFYSSLNQTYNRRPNVGRDNEIIKSQLKPKFSFEDEETNYNQGFINDLEIQTRKNDSVSSLKPKTQKIEDVLSDKNDLDEVYTDYYSEDLDDKSAEYYDDTYEEIEKKQSKILTRTSDKSSEIKPIRTSAAAQKHNFESRTLDFSKTNKKVDPNEVRHAGRLTLNNSQEGENNRRLMGQGDVNENDSNSNQMIRDGNGYKFKRKKYTSSLVKDVNNLGLDQIDKIASGTNDFFDERIGTINIKSNLARKRSALMRQQEGVGGLDKKAIRTEHEEDYTRYIKGGNRNR
ncbi:hypothetical protein [Spiroplasma endosymbiont of Aspidapion aeneum]|uniref:hypothetical protein n=1 Tax=Spiroplasma endosymbiont of Aspidapion aeneum TaxID=3066276 RepID=UPI00313F31B2